MIIMSPPPIKRDYPDRPFVGVGVVVWHGGNVLLVKRGHPPRLGQWSLPGGAQHLGETIEDAARREVREETGLDVRITGLLDVIDLIDHDEAGVVRHHYTLVDLGAEALTFDPVPGDDAAEAQWVPSGQLAAYDLWDETLRVIGIAATRRGSAGS